MKLFVIGGVTVGESDERYEKEIEIVQQAMNNLGKNLVEAGHDLLVCSPYEGSVDIEAVRGAASVLGSHQIPHVEFYYPDTLSIREELESLKKSLSLNKVRLFPCAPPSDENSKESWLYAWILAQLSAMSHSNAVIALGGKQTSSANLLLLLAEAQRKKVLPLTLLGGASAQAFQRRQYELVDHLGDRIAAVSDLSRIGEIVALAEDLAGDKRTHPEKIKPLHFFISYPRSRPQEADFVEMSLRRRNLTVFRDERDFHAGHSVPGAIKESIHRADVFVAIWCKEYACSPWCYDELDLALERRQAGSLALWIVCIDDTRIVPPLARELVHYPARTREELDGLVSRLLAQFESKT